MLYCPVNVTLNDVWIHNGLSQCFIDTVVPPLILGLMVVAGGIQWGIYRKYATPLDVRLLQRKAGYRIHISLMLTLAMLTWVRVCTLFVWGTPLGHHFVWAACLFPAWIAAAALTSLERHWALPSIPTYGHGLPLLLFWSASLILEVLSFMGLNSPSWWFLLHVDRDSAETTFFAVRFFLTLAVFIFGLVAPSVPKSSDYVQFCQFPSPEREPLLEHAEEGASTFRGFCGKLRLLLPFLWPRRKSLLQFLVICCFIILVSGRAINIFIPVFNKKVVDSLKDEGHMTFPWIYILLYVLLWTLQGQGSSSLLYNLRSFLWIPVQQYTVREVQVELYTHLHGLSLRWHLGRKTGEVLKILDRGTSSVTQLLSYILFNILPAIADILIAVVYFVGFFNPWFGLIIFVTMAVYLASTITLTEWRTKYRRDMNLLDNAATAKGVDALLNFETVKYYNAEEYEVQGYKECVEKFQVAEWRTNASLNLLNIIQTVVISLGTLTGTLLCAHMVVTHQSGLTVGDYVLFLTYIMQLYQPLNFLGTYYRMIQRSFIDMENMFELLSIRPEVVDAVNAPTLKVTKGVIKVDKVCFSYEPERPILKNISFDVPAGRTMAIVGPSGAGKSTIIRLLLRLYNVQSGNIYIDDQDIATVKQRSLRQAIGIVPQDTVLFNNNIRYNIRYGRVDASDTEVEDAARAAELHDQILGFPQGYNTIVGERGLKLSGGEKQRVAIARTILKAPAIILLDEATSSLDTKTERNIQASLDRICSNRTTLIVAHRLSTVIHADQILVLREGEITEAGSHEELLELGGLYAEMWSQQQRKGEVLPDEGIEES
uniref:ATP-binding cassette sub-family B member 6 n=1 Tax=Ornithodoros turicata TaxID=34597 RepID=A0A2R5L9K5_9ACAR